MKRRASSKWRGDDGPSSTHVAVQLLNVRIVPDTNGPGLAQPTGNGVSSVAAPTPVVAANDPFQARLRPLVRHLEQCDRLAKLPRTSPATMATSDGSGPSDVLAERVFLQGYDAQDQTGHNEMLVRKVAILETLYADVKQTISYEGARLLRGQPLKTALAFGAEFAPERAVPLRVTQPVAATPTPVVTVPKPSYGDNDGDDDGDYGYVDDDGGGDDDPGDCGGGGDDGGDDDDPVPNDPLDVFFGGRYESVSEACWLPVTLTQLPQLIVQARWPSASPALLYDVIVRLPCDQLSAQGWFSAGPSATPSSAVLDALQAQAHRPLFAFTGSGGVHACPVSVLRQWPLQKLSGHRQRLSQQHLIVELCQVHGTAASPALEPSPAAGSGGPRTVDVRARSLLETMRPWFDADADSGGSGSDWALLHHVWHGGVDPAPTPTTTTAATLSTPDYDSELEVKVPRPAALPTRLDAVPSVIDASPSMALLMLTLHTDLHTLRLAYGADRSAMLLALLGGAGLVRALAAMIRRQPHMACFGVLARGHLNASQKRPEWRISLQLLPDMPYTCYADHTQVALDGLWSVAHASVAPPPVNWPALTASLAQHASHFSTDSDSRADQLARELVQLAYNEPPLLLSTSAPSFGQQLRHTITVAMFYRAACAVHDEWIRANQDMRTNTIKDLNTAQRSFSTAKESFTTGHAYSDSLTEAVARLTASGAVLCHPMTVLRQAAARTSTEGAQQLTQWMRLVVCAALVWLAHHGIIAIEPADSTTDVSSASALRTAFESQAQVRCYTARAAVVENGLAETVSSIVRLARSMPAPTPAEADDWRFVQVWRRKMRTAMILKSVQMAQLYAPPPPLLSLSASAATPYSPAAAMEAGAAAAAAASAASAAAAQCREAEQAVIRDRGPFPANTTPAQRAEMTSLWYAAQAYRQTAELAVAAIRAERPHLASPKLYTRHGYAALPAFDPLFQSGAEGLLTALLDSGSVNTFPHRLVVNEEAALAVAQQRNFGVDQMIALQKALRAPFTCITGGGGTGKTQLLEALVAGFGVDQTALFAPTGRSCVVCNKRLRGMRITACTLHSGQWEHTKVQALRARVQASLARRLASSAAATSKSASSSSSSSTAPPETILQQLSEARAQHRARAVASPLSGKPVIILDESGLNSADIMHMLLRLMHSLDGPSPVFLERIILIGDNQQLEPVEWGQPFVDLAAAAAQLGTLCQLRHNYRSVGRTIVSNANAILNAHALAAASPSFVLSSAVVTVPLVYNTTDFREVRLDRAADVGVDFALSSRGYDTDARIEAAVGEAVRRFVVGFGYVAALRSGRPESAPSLTLLTHTNDMAALINRAVRRACFGDSVIGDDDALLAETGGVRYGPLVVHVGDKFYFVKKREYDLRAWFDTPARKAERRRQIANRLARATAADAGSMEALQMVSRELLDDEEADVTDPCAGSREMTLYKGELLRVVRFYDPAPREVGRLCRCGQCSGDSRTVACLDPTVVPPAKRSRSDSGQPALSTTSVPEIPFSTWLPPSGPYAGRGRVMVPPERIVVFVDELDRLREMPAAEAFGRAGRVAFGHAMTINMSQGSELDAVGIVHVYDSPHVHRRHIYTAITRAKQNVVTISRPTVGSTTTTAFANAARRPAPPRRSALAGKLVASINTP